MKPVLAAIAALALVSGCVAVPYQPPAVHPAYYGQEVPVRAYPAPAPVYVGPPVHFRFGLSYSHREHGYHGHRHFDRRHGHRGAKGRWGFRGRFDHRR